MAEDYNNEGNDRYSQDDFNNAIYSYTEGIKTNCKDETLKAELYSNRAEAYFCLGKARYFFNNFLLTLTICQNIKAFTN